MSNNKIIMTALGVSILSTVAIVGAIDGNAWGNNGSNNNVYVGRMVWNGSSSNKVNGRYQKGYFNESQLMLKNPTLKDGDYKDKYNDASKYYTKNYNQKVQTASKEGYKYNILYYEPYAKGDGTNYVSPQADGVDENYYAYYSAISGYQHSLNWSGSDDNFSNRDAQPNNGAQDSYPSAGSKVTNSYDKRFKVNGQWRFLGYSINGTAMSNPFFPADSGAFKGHRSDAGIINQDIHGQYGTYKAKRYLDDLSTFDDWVYEEDKLNAINKLINEDPAFKNGTITQVDASTGKTRTLVKGGTIKADLWASCLSLLTNPLTETPIFAGHRDSGNRYVDVVGITDDKLLSEIQVKSVILSDMNGNLIKRFDRSSSGETSWTGTGSVSPGQQIKVQYIIENTGKSWTTVNPSKIKAGVAYGDNAYMNDSGIGYSYNESDWTVQGGSKIAPGKSYTFPAQTITVASNASKAFRVTGYMHDDYMIAEESGVYSNDWGHVIVNVKNGDTALSSIKLIDLAGNEVSYMKPGEEYKTQYIFKYTGADVRFQDYYWEDYWCSHADSADSHWDRKKIYYDVKKDFKFSWTATRYLPGGGSELFKDSETVSINSLKNGTTWTYETPYFVYEIPKADASASMSAPTQGTDSNKDNNSGSKDWSYNYDVQVDNVKVYNTNERPTQNGNITLGLKYDINVVAPDKVAYFETDIKTHITLPNGQVIAVTDHVGKGNNSDITREIQVPVSVITSGSKNLNVTVKANVDKKFWEIDLDTQTNNQKSNYAVQLPPINPTVSKGCSVVKNNSSFSVTHASHAFSGTTKTWTKFNGTKSYSFYKFSFVSKSNTTKTYTENYKITSVKFKSKDTVDKGYGWVELTTSDRKNATIKAGYGYELQIDVTYNTDALTNQPKSYHTINSVSSYGTIFSNLNHKANIYKDIYVKTSDDKILSATGMYGTTSAFDVQVVQSDSSTTILRYTMKKTAQNGISTPMKIYTSENRTDGNETLSVWTPTITGVGNPKKPNTSLCDEKKGLTFKIQGSMYDDNQDSIIQ